MNYPFSVGGLRDSSIVLKNYMERNVVSGKVSWDDLRYIFGKIMYSCHIVDDRDRTLNITYLENLMKDILFNEVELFPCIEGKNISFKCPGALTYSNYIKHIEENLSPEIPLAYGMHPNSEIDFMTNQCLTLFRTLVELQPKDFGDNLKIEKTQELMSKINDEIQLDQNMSNMEDIVSKLGENRDPYKNVFLRKCEYVSILINEILKSLADLD